MFTETNPLYNALARADCGDLPDLHHRTTGARALADNFCHHYRRGATTSQGQRDAKPAPDQRVTR